MMAHSDGDLVKAIHDYVILSDEVRSKFSDLFENDSEVEVEDRMTILKYIAERYVHMRGCWFVKFMKNNRNKSLGETKALAAPTRAKVAHKHVESKTVAKAIKESVSVNDLSDSSGVKKQIKLWNQVAESVLEHEDNEDNEEEDGESDVEYTIDE